MSESNEQDRNTRPLTLEARVIIALVKRFGATEIEISAEELAEAVGLAMYPSDDAKRVIINVV